MNTMMDDPVSSQSIVDQLSAFGLLPTCHLMVHASLSQFGHVEEGGQTVIDALRDIAGPNGAVIAPSFRDAIRSDYYALRACRTCCPQSLCPSNERGYTGIIGETVRQQIDSLRSCHPTHSWVGIGKGAKYLLEGHRNSPTPCGKDSPFLRLLDLDGYVLLLGVGVASLTNIHAVEEVRNAPYLSAVDPANRHATYTTSGKRIQYAYPDIFSEALIQCNVLRELAIGQATCSVISARKLASYLWIVTDDDPWCLVLRPRHGRYDPEDDALRKTRRMIETWQSQRDDSAWMKFYQASQRDVVPPSFTPTASPQTKCPAYRGQRRNHHRCAANDLPPWEHFDRFPSDEPGVATCDHCNWLPSNS